MGFCRLLPNTRATAEEVKKHAYQDQGVLVIDLEKDQIPWEFKTWLEQWGAKRFGPRRTRGK